MSRRVEPHPYIEGGWTIVGGAESERLPLFASRSRAEAALHAPYSGTNYPAQAKAAGEAMADLVDWAKTKLDPWEANE